ncbi:MAG TPA: pantoate--beta-alanine ligase, partial [Candidatus Acidoferrales bacterium]|nr:pantoate--beta-alanine ligase [Candidatus Acidoferrales bacterium]
VCPIVRGPDGLALSSRNAYLKGDERRAATVLYHALNAARREIVTGERDSARLLAVMRKVIEAEPLASADYAEIVDRESFEPVYRLRRACLALLAVFVGSVRLIDNMLIEEREDVFTISL